MFARIKKNTGTSRRTVLICHSLRVDGRVRQLTVKTLGHSSDESQLARWLEEAKRWIAANESAWRATHLRPLEQRKRMNRTVNLFQLEEKARLNVGMEDVFGPLYEALGFHTLLSAKHQATLRQVIYARLLEPSSKRRASTIAEEAFGEALGVDRIYQMMDKLLESSEDVERHIFEATQRSVGKPLSLVLFDVTTLSFETISEDDLRAFGFSKDFKFNTTQVVLALATTQEGLPVGYRLFPGNTAESNTLIASVEAWRKHIPIEAVTIAGDRAMMSEANLAALEAAGFYYVIACPLRRLPKAVQQPILDKSGYTTQDEADDVTRYRILPQGHRQLVVTYSPKRAAKDRKDRERAVKKLEKKLKTCKQVKRLINNKSYLKYTEIAGQASATIDEEKIEREAQWDGLHGVLTNKPVSGCEVYQDYRRLWVIEESFRINKHNLKMRPIYHFTPRRIKAHILLCYMVFALIRQAQFRLAQANISLSAARIIDAVRQVQASILQDDLTGKQYRVLSALKPDAKLIYEAFNLQKGRAVAQIV